MSELRQAKESALEYLRREWGELRDRLPQDERDGVGQHSIFMNAVAWENAMREVDALRADLDHARREITKLEGRLQSQAQKNARDKTIKALRAELQSARDVCAVYAGMLIDEVGEDRMREVRDRCIDHEITTIKALRAERDELRGLVGEMMPFMREKMATIFVHSHCETGEPLQAEVLEGPRGYVEWAEAEDPTGQGLLLDSIQEADGFDWPVMANKAVTANIYYDEGDWHEGGYAAYWSIDHIEPVDVQLDLISRAESLLADATTDSVQSSSSGDAPCATTNDGEG